MSETILTFPDPRSEDEYKATLEWMFAEMQRLNQKIQEDQAEIDRLKAETRVLKAETDVIKTRTQARLDALTEMVLT